MKTTRRNFCKLIPFSILPISGSTLKEKETIEIRVNLYQTELFKHKVTEEQKKMVKLYSEKCLESLSNETKKVEPSVKFIEETVEETDNLTKWGLQHIQMNNGRPAHSNILLTGDDTLEGEATINCPKCYSVGIAEAGNLKNFEVGERIPYEILRANDAEMTLVLIAHEIGHSIGLDHNDGRTTKSYGAKLVCSPMVTSKDIVNEYSHKEDITELDNYFMTFVPSYNKDIDYVLDNIVRMDSVYNRFIK